ncbi:tetratricopeptide repeat protein [Synoicihabitans lomoniglobus]|uniref:Tetratricopeptide repeat protein n=1 Tax=Synoicihabitans lomoniglobus TaxID=2909285 RepID=A0AAE9ZWU1_9BACT|nr:hypothetical protein [Opitutaceae bacterium LMO-M01]WED64886.1 hypothetical protein PXH66_21275 [Opitutaceae bacterium LMO-M01]
MRICRILLIPTLLSLAVASPGRAQSADEGARAELQALLVLQQELLGRAAAAEHQDDVDDLRPRMQTLVFDFEKFLRTYPKNTDGLVAYSMLLGNPLIDERERAKALLLKANSLNPELPIVQNQLGKYLAEEGKPLDALNYFLSAVQLRPDEPLYHFQVGQLLGAARDDFLRSGEWTVTQVDTAMQHALAEAVRLEPESLPYAYRYAESYYDLHETRWTEALEKWEELEARVESPAEKQLMRLHRANVLMFAGDLDAAEVLLEGAFEEVLLSQRGRLLTRLARLRADPGVEEAEAEAVAAAARKGETGSGPVVAAPEVPVFTAPAAPEIGPLNSETVVTLTEENPFPGEPEVEAPVETPLADEETVDSTPR